MPDDKTNPATPTWRLQSSGGSVGPDVSGLCFVRITNGREVVEGHGATMLDAKENAFRKALRHAGQ